MSQIQIKIIPVTVCLTILGLVSVPWSSSQDSAPTPKNTDAIFSAPTPGSINSNDIPLPSNQLPLNAAEVKTKLEEIKSLIPIARPQDLQEVITNLCQWLGDLIQAHNRLAVTFSKSDLTKPQSETEKQSARYLQQLKNQAQLIKARLLINQNHCSEALQPLIDIVSAEPNSATGQEAYRYLKEIGFCQNSSGNTKPTVSSAIKVISPTSNQKPPVSKPSTDNTAPDLLH